MFDIFRISPVFGFFWGLIFFGGIILFFFILGSDIRRARINSKQPVKKAEAKVVAKRIKVWGDHSHTNYYVTFEYYNSERAEFEVEEGLYGLLVEGDTGMLTYQGYRVLDFRRF